MHDLLYDTCVGISGAFSVVWREPVSLHLRTDRLHCRFLLVVLAEVTSEVRPAVTPEVNTRPVRLQVLAQVFLRCLLVLLTLCVAF